ncbi:MAG: alkaline phosphatase family protein [Steroidobacteraceae bacterium]
MRRPAAAITAFLAWGTALAALPADRNLILVTLDGVRTQEIFGGMDPVLANAPEAESGIYDSEVTRKRYWRDTPEARREALMPFFWQTLTPAGMVLGNQAKGSKVTVRNDQWFSYPGYSEILTGEAQPEIKTNDFVRYPHRTVLEHIREILGLVHAKVAQLGSWDGFKYAASSRDGAFFMNGAREPLPPELSTPGIDLLVDLREDVMQLWEESSNDVLTFRIALAYLKKHKPRVMWLGLGQSDDWAHARRYDLVLDYLKLTDGELAELWQTLQSMDEYRGKTTLIVTVDHGRGRTPADWAEHGAGIQGSQDIWVAIIGPDTPAIGEAKDFPEVTQSDIAATMLQYLGLDWRRFNSDAGPPIPGSLESR